MDKNKQNSFFNNVLVMSSAPIITQVISFVFMPIITRLFSPSAFGLFHVFNSLIGPLTSFPTLGYHQAIVIPKNNKNAINLLYGNFFLTIIFFLISFLIFFYLPDIYWAKMNFIDLDVFWWAIPTALLLHGLNTALSSWNQRNLKYSCITISRVSNAFINKVFVICMGAIGYANTGSLIQGFLVGAIIMFLVQVTPLTKFFFKYQKTFFNYLRMVFVLKRYRKFPLFIMTSDLLFRLINSSIIIILVFFFSNEVVGYYSMANMLAGIPSILLGGSIAEVYYQKAASQINNQEKNDFIINLYKRLVKFSIFSYLLLSVISPELFLIAFGSKWEQSGFYVQLLSLRMFVDFIMSPFISLTKIIKKEQYFFYLQLSTLVLSIIAIVIGGILKNPLISIFLLSLFNAIAVLSFGIFTLNMIRISSKVLVYWLFKYFIFAVPFIIPVIIVKYFFIFSDVNIILSGITLFIMHSFILLRTDKVIYSKIRKLFNK